MTIKTVTVCGSGVLGSQIAYQTAFHGFDVRLYDIDDEAIARARTALAKLAPRYEADLKASAEQTAAAHGRIQFFTDLAQAVAGADLVIEAIPERLDIKQNFYGQLGAVAGPQTIFATNSSTLLPSDMMEFTGRPEKFLALHFANEIWTHNTAEVMPTPRTDPAVFAEVIAFAQSIGMVALPLHKEQPGYILNTLLVPLLSAGLELVVKGVADPETVDASLRALATHEPELPDIGSSTHLRFTLDLGEGEATFLNARSALWSWRPHRQSGVRVHTHGPPVVGRDVLLEQRAGLVTVLQGCRVLTLQESDHDWGFTLGSLNGQVYHLWERLLLERHPDDRVTLLISSHHAVVLRGFGLVSGLLHSARRNAVQGYARGMSALTES